MDRLSSRVRVPSCQQHAAYHYQPTFFALLLALYGCLLTCLAWPAYYRTQHVVLPLPAVLPYVSVYNVVSQWLAVDDGLFAARETTTGMQQHPTRTCARVKTRVEKKHLV